jgi:hypothetical protein
VSTRPELERVEIPQEHEARERAWVVLQSAFAQRTPVERRPRYVAVAVAFAVGLTVVGAAVSPPGKAVIDQIREAVGVENAAPALFGLPSPGRLLVHSDRGIWVVQQNGSRRLLGRYREASWSPFGRYVVAARENELAALEPDGTVRWTLARPDVRSPRWTGSRTDTRIAYADHSGIRIVAGDGTGDRLLVPDARGPLAWRPGSRRALAEIAGRRVRVQDVDSRRVLWSARLAAGADPVRTLAWSADGRRLLLVQPFGLRVYDASGHLLARDDPADGSEDVDAAFVPSTRRVAVVRRHGAQSTVFWLDTGAPLFSGTGTFAQVTFSPEGRFAFVAWPTADQWVFVRLSRVRKRIRGVSNVSPQFHSHAFPRVEGWASGD